MKIRVVPARQLTPEQLKAWCRIQQTEPTLDSPYFRPEFTQAVAAVRDDVEVAVLEEQGRPAGFFPYQRGKFDTGRPVGGRLSDFKGVVIREGDAPDAEELVRECGLTAWDFDHLLASQQPFVPHHWQTADSPYIDLSNGFEAYQAERRKSGSKKIKQIGKLSRRLEREAGPLRFEPHVSDRSVFKTLLAWKREQYRRNGLTDLFAFDWTVALLERILDEREERFAGMLSVLYAGDEPAAIEFSMRSHDVLHSWFPAYNPEFAAHSPGMIHLLETIRAAPSLGIRRIHLGKGDEPYKSSFISGTVRLAEGSVDRRPLKRLLRKRWHRTCEWLRASPLRKPARRPARFVRRVYDRLTYC
jgi:CelD/BcsL family acetyltransferase involved in cellulose biosynthesis